MARKRRNTKPPVLTYTLLTRDTHREIYLRLDKLIAAHHEELRDARVALAWCTSWRADLDGKQTLGRCKRASALDRELAVWDFVILLNEKFWSAPETREDQRDALLDHELCHATVKDDAATGEPLQDARGRTVYRLRKHDLEEFSAIADRYGLWKRDIEQFHQALNRGAQQPKLPIGSEPTEDAPNTYTAPSSHLRRVQ